MVNKLYLLHLFNAQSNIMKHKSSEHLFYDFALTRTVILKHYISLIYPGYLSHVFILIALHASGRKHNVSDWKLSVNCYNINYLFIEIKILKTPSLVLRFYILFPQSPKIRVELIFYILLVLNLMLTFFINSMVHKM